MRQARSGVTRPENSAHGGGAAYNPRGRPGLPPQKSGKSLLRGPPPGPPTPAGDYADFKQGFGNLAGHQRTHAHVGFAGHARDGRGEDGVGRVRQRRIGGERLPLEHVHHRPDRSRARRNRRRKPDRRTKEQGRNGRERKTARKRAPSPAAREGKRGTKGFGGPRNREKRPAARGAAFEMRRTGFPRCAAAHGRGGTVMDTSAVRPAAHGKAACRRTVLSTNGGHG